MSIIRSFYTIMIAITSRLLVSDSWPVDVLSPLHCQYKIIYRDITYCEVLPGRYAFSSPSDESVEFAELDGLY
jgi:hypothetical protein